MSEITTWLKIGGVTGAIAIIFARAAIKAFESLMTAQTETAREGVEREKRMAARMDEQENWARTVLLGAVNNGTEAQRENTQQMRRLEIAVGQLACQHQEGNRV